MKIIITSLLSVFLLSGCGTFNKILKSNDIDYKYKKVQEFYAAKKYSYVIQLLGPEFFPLLKGTKEFESAFYMLAYANFYQKDYFNAGNLFEQYAKTFPNSDKAIEMDYMQAYIYYLQSPKIDLEQTNTIKTIGMMNTFIKQHPDSEKSKEAFDIVEKCKAKLELKDFKAAQLYYHMEQYKAAFIAFGNMVLRFPESDKGDEYKLMAIKSFYNYAGLSVEEKREERFEQVIAECNDFFDKYPDSKWSKEIEQFMKNSSNNLKNIKNEQTSKTTGG
jgi:outer membrane protein assembly factor BamD